MISFLKKQQKGEDEIVIKKLKYLFISSLYVIRVRRKRNGTD